MPILSRTISRALFTGGLIATPIGLFVVQRDWSLPRCKSTELITGRTVIITGANSGMGKELANVLAVKGGRVIMACRNMEKCEEVRKKFIEATFNRQIVCKHLDLASLDSVRTFAKDINENEKRLDILVNNAGAMGFPKKEITKEGFEKHFGVNYLGPFLLTNLLLDKMKRCSRPTVPGRIINITCGRNEKAEIDFPDLNFMNKDYNWKDAYFQSKSAFLLFTQELAKRTKGTDVKTFAVNPGLVNTDLGTKYSKHGKSKLFHFFTTPFRYLAQKGIAEGIQTALMCCIDSNLKSQSGKYYENCGEVELATWDEKDKEQVRLWAISERWTHIVEDCKTEKS